MKTKRVISSTLFPNGMIVTFGMFGQIPELQGEYSIELHRRILKEKTPLSVLLGFNLLPPGFISTAENA